MLGHIIDYVSIGIIVAELLENFKNQISWVVAKNRYEFLQEGVDVPYGKNYSFAIVFLVFSLLWPITVFSLFGEAKNPEEDFSSESE
jgi:hypothetical protein